MNNCLIIGMNGHVVAICPESGTEIWRTKLSKGLFSSANGANVSVLNHQGFILAGCNGHLYGLNESNGEILWQNELSGAGYGDISLSMDGCSIQYIEKTVVEERTNHHRT